MGKGSAGVQGLSGDGITVCGRLTGFIGVFVLLFLSVSFFTPNWSVTYELTTGEGLDPVTEATFGLREFCIKTQTAIFVEQQFTCFEYDDMLRIKFKNISDVVEQAIAEVVGNDTSPICGAKLIEYEAAVDAVINSSSPAFWYNATGCDRFDGVCEFGTFEIVRVLLMAAIIACIAGATFSEKIPFYGAMLLVATLLSTAAVSIYAAWADSLDNNLETTIGLGIIAGAIIFAFIGTLLAGWDVCRSEGRASLSDDGIDLFGRMGSLLTVCTWLFMAISIVMPTWTSVDELGNVGGLCNDDCLYADCNNIQATFGLISYCVDTAVELTGNAKKEKVCMYYTDEVSIVGSNVTITGFERFDEFGLEGTVTLTFSAMCIGIISSAFADIFSEKLIPATILSLLAGLAGVTTLIVWLTFQSDLDSAVPGSAESSDGVYVLGTAFAIAFFTMIVYGINACKWYRSERATLKG